METTIDPVCGMRVPAVAPRGGSHVHNGVKFAFCNPSCRERFVADPGKYVAPPRADSLSTNPETGATGDWVCPMDPEVHSNRPGPCPKCGMALEPKTPTPQSKTAWVCPMHPEIVRDGPGSCPICGMALEPRTVSADDAPNPELLDMSRRLWVSVPFTLALLGLAMAEMFGWHAPSWLNWLELVLATPVVLWAGLPFFQRAVSSVRNRSLNMFTLIGLGVSVAYAYSVMATLFPGFFPQADAHGRVGVYFEPAAVIVALVLLGQVLELRARAATGGALRALLKLQPSVARRVDGEVERDVPLSEVKVGDVLRVRPGEKVPVDGIVLDGRTSIDESLVSGEAIPVEKGPGEAVTGGTLNQSGSVRMRAERVGQDTLLASIVRMVGEAQRSRAPIQRVADRVSAIFVPAVVLIAAVTGIVWGLWGPEPRLAHALVNAVAVLIIACPCALGLATPMSVMVGTGRGAQLGVLFRDAAALERLERVNTLVIDKTGTVTEGRPVLTAVQRAAGWADDEVLGLAASVERGSEHPLAAAISTGARERGIALLEIDEFESRAGEGISARVQGRRVSVGRDDAARSTEEATLLEAVRSWRERGRTLAFVRVDGALAGVLGIEDPVKASARAALQRLRRDGVTVVMATGDHATTARAVADAVGLTEVRAGVRPAEKAALVAEFQSRGRVVAMAGDGVNDAPALARADVGIAMGTGTDVALQSAGVTLVSGDLQGVVRARKLSRATVRNIRENLGFAFGYNLLGVPIAAGVLFPFFGWLLSPMLASAAMSLSSVSVIGNALRLRRVHV